MYCVSTAEGEKTNAIEFFDARAEAYVFTPLRKRPEPEIADKMTLGLLEGCGVLFPSWLMHWVRGPKTNGRCSMSWNLLLRDGVVFAGQ